MKRRPRVVVVWHAGVVPGYLALFEELGKRCDLTLVTPPWWVVAGRRFDAPAAGRGYRLLAMEPWFRLRESTLWYPGLRGFLREWKPDLVHFKQEPTHWVCLQARGLGCKLVFETAQNLNQPPGFPWSWVQAAVFKASDAAVAFTGEIEAVLRGFGYDKPVAVLPLWVDTRRFRPGIKAAAKAALGLRGKKVLGYVGRLSPEKGLDVFLDALERLGKGWTALWAGDGPSRPDLEKDIARRGLGRRVRILGPLDQDALARAYQAMDCLAVPSLTTPHWKEQFGRVLVEAMACGVPCVGSDSGSIPEVMGSAGRVFREGDAAAMAAAVKKTAADPSAPRAALARSRRFGAAAVAGDLAGAYRLWLDAS